MTHPVGTLLFVYGTLQIDLEHPNGVLLREHSERLGRGWIRARLYIIDDPDEPGQNFYPGAVPSASNDDRVYGEIYRVTNPDAIFPVFDDYEACSERWPEPHEFLLRTLPVTMENGERFQALSYLYSWDVSDATRVPSGRYEKIDATVR